MGYRKCALGNKTRKEMIDKTRENDTSTLTNLPIGQDANVSAVNGTGVLIRRLKEMGVIPGAAVKVIKTAPFGDPIEVRVRGYNLAMRRSEADSVDVIY